MSIFCHKKILLKVKSGEIATLLIITSIAVKNINRAISLRIWREWTLWGFGCTWTQTLSMMRKTRQLIIDYQMGCGFQSVNTCWIRLWKVGILYNLLIVMVLHCFLKWLGLRRALIPRTLNLERNRHSTWSWSTRAWKLINPSWPVWKNMSR